MTFYKFVWWLCMYVLWCAVHKPNIFCYNGVRCILLRQTLTLQFPFSMCLYVTMPNRIMHATATQYNTKQVFIQFASLQWWRSSIVITLVIQTHTTVQISARMTLITWTMVIGPFHFLTSTPSSYSS